MRPIEWGAVIFWLIVPLLAIAAIYHFRTIIEASASIFAAIISGSVLIMGGILTHLTTELRAQHAERRARRREIYYRVLGKLAPLIRNSAVSDDFVTVYCETCIVGSHDVTQSMANLITKAKDGIPYDELTNLLLAMRSDLELPAVPINGELLFGKQDKGHTVRPKASGG